MGGECFSGWTSEETLKVIETNGRLEVIVKGQRYMSWQVGDETAVRTAIVQLCQNGIGTEQDLAQTFKRHISSVKRYIADFEKDGIEGLIPGPRGPQSRWKLTKTLRAKILLIALKEGVQELEDIQTRLKILWNEAVSLPTIREVLTDNGLWNEASKVLDFKTIQGELFDEKESGEQLALRFDGRVNGIEIKEETQDEDCEETKAEDDRIGLNAEPTRKRNYSTGQRLYSDRLEQGDYNTYAGGLLFMPLLERYSFLPILKRIINLPTYEGYRLEELCQTLFYFDVFGFRSMEDFKRAYPEEFGILVGRSQSPSLFTLRRFLHKVRELEIGEGLIDAFATEYLKSKIAKWGVLYIDGHFLPYHGMYPITKGYHAVRQMPMKGSYHFIGVDEKFRPWLFLIRSSSEDLLEKIPEMIEKGRKIGGEAGLSKENLKNLIVIFDREGYSAELYRYLNGRDGRENHERVIFISWAKYTDKWVHDIEEEKFNKTTSVTYEIRKSKKIKYFETKRTMNKYGAIRTIVIQSGAEKKRSAIYTNSKTSELKPERIIKLICRRWGEENLIKELMMKHLINYMPGYVFEEIEEQPMVKNPKIKPLKKERATHTHALHKLKIQLADRVLKKGKEHADWDETRKSEPKLSEEIIKIDNTILSINREIDKLPRQIQYEEAYDGERLQKLNYEKKRFLDAIKVFTYNIKEEMCQILLKYYPSRKEVLSALQMIVERTGYVKLEGGQLKVRLRRFQDQEINRAARGLCEELNFIQPRTLDRYRFPTHYEVL